MPSRLTRATSCSVLFILRTSARGLSSSSSSRAPRLSGYPAIRSPWATRRTGSFVSTIRATSICAPARRSFSQRPSEADTREVHQQQNNKEGNSSSILDIMAAENPRLGFIGAGMMASAMINGIVAAKTSKPDDITASDLYNQSSLDRLSASGVRTTASNSEVAAGSRVVFLAVKPDVIPAVLQEINEHVSEDTLVVSIAPGVTLSLLEELAPGKRVVRVMPNTPCLVSEMAAAFCLGSLATEEDKELLESLLGSVGHAIEVPESKLDAVTGLSGSGPAYVFIMIEALADGGVRMGLPRATALELAAQTVKGAATMVLETGTHPAVLKDQVCSPGGTTIAAVEALEKGGFRSAAIEAVVAATNRSIEIRNAKK